MCFLIVWNKLEDLVGFDFLIFYKFYRIYKLNFRFIEICIKMVLLFFLLLCVFVYM